MLGVLLLGLVTSCAAGVLEASSGGSGINSLKSSVTVLNVSSCVAFQWCVSMYTGDGVGCVLHRWSDEARMQ